MLISETWETKSMDIPHIINSRILQSFSFVRNRDHPSFLPQTGGGAAILFDDSKFNVTSAETNPPLGVEAVWTVISPKETVLSLQSSFGPLI